ncbi:MAG: hypothetical protein BWX88_01985 [Planctomycetes bacterium ADurb.Bin126]|nr:MAG: hypothetical protein BWX88_01985 [Planctomycetes bacterium ADurb.Bin126]HOD82466.1 sialate O-acetylesterase [Phycisphaerae bacterium]HQL73003.1 sialate O-acetylesterase [Phycisphaerae bacterium]
MTRRALCAVVLCLAFAAAGSAKVRVAKVFGDRMVLQQELPIAVWGWADAGEPVTVELAGKSTKAQAGADGAWRVDLPPLKADGKEHTLTVQGPTNRNQFKNILLGEVWLASGQSNMSRSVTIKDSTPGVRVFLRSENERREAIPVRDDYDDGIQCTWTLADPNALKAAPQTMQRGDKLGPHTGYGEVAYVFARSLHEELKVPVGVLNIAVGGSTAKAWTPLPGIEKAFPFGQQAEGRTSHEPGMMYQSQLRPVVPLTIRGAIWYQGEDDGRNNKYADDLAALIASWRTLWKRPDLPFYFVQIAQTTYASGMLGVYEAQVKIMHTVPNTALAVSNDIYDNSDNPKAIRNYEAKDPSDPAAGLPIAGNSNPHPPNKHLVARRLANIALVKTYGQPDRPLFGPMYDSHKIEGDKVLVKFKYACDGLKAADGKALNWFELSDGTLANRKLVYIKAEAKIVGKDTIEVSCPRIKTPKFVRFAWNSLARHNLVNSGNLPAVPFRTDP